MFSMKKCIGCGEPARCNSGHIHTEMGTVAVGWCGDGSYCYKGCVKPNLVSYCQSVNPNSCYGKFKFSDIEIKEEINANTLTQHAESEEFSKIVDAEIYGKRNRPVAPIVPRKKSIFQLFFGI